MQKYQNNTISTKKSAKTISTKAPAIIYADFKCLFKKGTHVKTILRNLIQIKKIKHTPSSNSIFTSCLFDTTKNKLDCYKG